MSNREPHMCGSLAIITDDGVYRKPVGAAGGMYMLLAKKYPYMTSNPGCNSLPGLRAQKKKSRPGPKNRKF
jgi:hypothetical protein